MKNTSLIGLMAAPLMAFILGLPAQAADPSEASTCKDGTASTATGRGACSGHGGVKKQSKTMAAAPAAGNAATAAPAEASASTPSTCKDGTTTTTSGRGACSGHGGVQKAPKAGPAPAAPNAATTAPHEAAAPAPTGTMAAPAAAAPSATMAPAGTMAKSSTATQSASTAAAGNTDPAGATAKCKDGTYSKSTHHTGACSHHGGVGEWLTAK